MLLSPHSLKSLNRIEKIQPRMMYATFNDYLCTIIVSCHSSTNPSDETDSKLSSLVQHISKCKVLIIVGDMNAQTGKD